MRRFLYAIGLFSILFFIQNVNSQVISIPDSVSYPCGSMSFPVIGESFPNDVGAVTIYIETDPDVITYTGNTPGTMAGYIFSYAPASGLITIVKSGVAPINLNGTILTIDFDYTGGSCDLHFGAGTEFTTIGLLNITYTAMDGSAGPMPRTNYYVDAAASPGGDGLSWATAFQTITAAADADLDRGDHVTIRPGSYNEAVVIKSNGLELVPVTTGVSITGTQTVVFPAGTDLSCIDAESYPDEIFLYLYRSLKGNNGAFEIQSIETSTRTVTVKGSDFALESGAAGDTTRLHASIAHAIVYRKDTSNSSPLIVDASGISTAKAVCYIGEPIGGGDDATPANYNILDGFSLTGIGSGAAGRFGLRIQGSQHNVFMRGSVYECDSVGMLISGNDSHPARRNIISKNTIYNTRQKGVKLGIEGATASNNRVHHNLILGNEIYADGTGSNTDFLTAMETHQYTSHNIIERNTFRDFDLKTGGIGAARVGNNSPGNLLIGNYFKDITDALAVTNALIYVMDNSPGTKVFNNVLVMSTALDDDIYAFRFDALGHNSSEAVYNTVYNVDKGVLFEDTGLPAPDFHFKNNVLNQLSDFYFTHVGNGGRFSVGYNCYEVAPTQSGGTHYWPDATSLTGNPQFLDNTFFGSPLGFSLRAGSICLSAGTPLTDLVVDYRYDSRDATNPSVGAFENIITETYWTGAVSNNWHDHRNWGPEIVPGVLLDAIIPLRNNDPHVINSDASCKSVEIQQGANVIVNTPRSLTIVN